MTDVRGVQGSGSFLAVAIGIKKAFVTRIHESAETQDFIYVSSGRIGVQIRLAPDDFCRAAGAEYADLLQERPAPED